MTTVEYITVNEGVDLWMIDYDNKKAIWKESTTVDDLEVNGISYINYEYSVYNYLIEQQYRINDEYNEGIIRFE